MSIFLASCEPTLSADSAPCPPTSPTIAVQLCLETPSHHDSHRRLTYCILRISTLPTRNNSGLTCPAHLTQNSPAGPLLGFCDCDCHCYLYFFPGSFIKKKKKEVRGKVLLRLFVFGLLASTLRHLAKYSLC